MKKITLYITTLLIIATASYFGVKKITKDINNDSCQSHTNPSFNCPLKTDSYF